MTGSSVFDYIHHQDHSEIAEQLGLGLTQGQSLASPGSGSEESTSTAGTNNPDGNEICLLIYSTHIKLEQSHSSHKPIQVLSNR